MRLLGDACHRFVSLLAATLFCCVLAGASGCASAESDVCASGGIAKSGSSAAAALTGSELSDTDDSAHVHTDESVMASMACEPVDSALLERMRIQLGYPRRAVQVEVGEGLTSGELWWVVVLDSPPDDSYDWGLRAFLTNAPGLSEGGTWIDVDFKSSDPWKNVTWDTERLARANAALEKALAYMESSS